MLLGASNPTGGDFSASELWDRQKGDFALIRRVGHEMRRQKQETGRQETGRQETGRQETGNQETEKQETGNQETGRQETGNQETGRQETEKQETGNQETGKQETEKGKTKNPKRLSREFFTRDGITVAKALLGKILVHETALGIVRGMITETESYMGENDKGSHTYGGKRTDRTEPMYHIGGSSYVYLIYGMYSCMNIAAMTEGIPQAVLLRSIVPADEESARRMLDLRLAELNRKQERKGGVLYTADTCPASLKKHLTDGPGKMCIAMGITRADNDIDLVKSSSFYVTEGLEIRPEQIIAAKRIGIDYAEEAADYLWRFYVNSVQF